MEILHRIEFWSFVAYLLLSVVASAFNDWIRSRAEAGEPVAPWVLRLAAGVNIAAANVDKARQLWRGYRGPSAAPKAGGGA